LASEDASALAVPAAQRDLTQLALPLWGRAQLPPAMPITAGGVPDTGAMRSMGLTKQADAFDANVAITAEVKAAKALPWRQRGIRMGELELRTGLDRSTLYRKAAKKLPELVPAWRTGRGATKCIPPDLQSQIIETRLRRPHASIAAIYNDLVIPFFSGDGKMCPHLTTVRRFIKAVVLPIAEALYRKGPAYFTMHCAPKVRRDLPTEPNAVWTIDHVKSNVFVVDERGHLRRLWITVAFDLATGALVGYRVGYTPTAAGVCHMLLRAITAFGLPKRLQRDGGKEFILRHLDGESEQLLAPREDDLGKHTSWPVGFPAEVERAGAWAVLGVELTTTLPRRPWAKAAESLIGAFFGSWECELPGFCGHKVGARPEWLQAQQKAGQVLTEDEYEQVLAKRAEEWDTTRIVGTREAAALSVYLAYNRDNPGALWRPDPAALSFLLQKEGTFRVYDDGLHFGKQTWWGDPLECFVGCTLTVRYGEDGDPIAYGYAPMGHVIPLAPEPRATWKGWSEANLRAERRLDNQKTYLRALMISVAGTAPPEAIDPTGAHRMVAARLKAAAAERARQDRARTDALTRPRLQLPELAAVARQIQKDRTRREAEERDLLTKGLIPPGDAPLPQRLAQAVDAQMLLAADIQTLRDVIHQHGLKQGQVGALCAFKRDKVHRLLTGKGSAKKQAVELPRLRQAVMALLAAKAAVDGGAPR
jgi:hypothetical protein